MHIRALPGVLWGEHTVAEILEPVEHVTQASAVRKAFMGRPDDPRWVEWADPCGVSGAPCHPFPFPAGLPCPPLRQTDALLSDARRYNRIQEEWKDYHDRAVSFEGPPPLTPDMPCLARTLWTDECAWRLGAATVL